MIEALNDNPNNGCGGDYIVDLLDITKFLMWLNVISAKFNARQCLPAVSPRVLVWGGWGVLCKDPTWLTAPLWMSSHLRFVIALWKLLLSDSSHCDFIPGLPLPFALVSLW